jgi:hypothetical protein
MVFCRDDQSHVLGFSSSEPNVSSALHHTPSSPDQQLQLLSHPTILIFLRHFVPISASLCIGRRVARCPVPHLLTHCCVFGVQLSHANEQLIGVYVLPYT